MEAEFISLFTLTWGCFRSKELKRSCCKSSLREVVLRDSARERERERERCPHEAKQCCAKTQANDRHTAALHRKFQLTLQLLP